MSDKKSKGYTSVPADYAIDAMALEAQRRAKELGRPYSYAQLMADTTEEERREIAEAYRRKLVAAIRQGRYRVSSGSGRLVIDDGTEGETWERKRHRRAAEGQ